jgi:hypothetical protein
MRTTWPESIFTETWMRMDDAAADFATNTESALESTEALALASAADCVNEVAVHRSAQVDKEAIV